MGTVTLTLPTSDFITTQGNLFLPILTDLAVYAVFRKARSFQVSELGGAIAGLAVGFYLSSRTSFLVNLTGAGLYAAYKVIHYIYASLEVAPPSDVELLEDAFDKLKDKVTITADNILDAASADFKQQFAFIAKTPDAISQTRKNWNDPAILRKTEKLMFRAYKVMRQELREAEEAVEDLTSDQDNRNVEIVENLDKTFYSAFKIFYQTYRHVHQMCYYIRLPNLQNADESDNLRKFSVAITEEDRHPFVLGVNPKCNMKQLYKYVNDLLNPLFEHFPKKLVKAWKKELQPEYPDAPKAPDPD